MKTPKGVEADAARSHQHEYNGNRDLIRVFGTALEKPVFQARFIYLTDHDDRCAAKTQSPRQASLLSDNPRGGIYSKKYF
jgi:hypothetical protein